MKSMTPEEIKATEVEILQQFDRYCRDHGLRYVIDYGTLLGAVRHKGFIPWDDDIDVTMPRQDYNRFLELTKTEPMGGTLEVRYDKATKGDLPYAKIVDTRTFVKEKNRYEKYYYPLWIDVFPVDGFKDREDLEKRLKKIRQWDRLRAAAVNKSAKEYSNLRGKIKYLYHRAVSPYGFLGIMTRIAESTAYDERKTGINLFTPYGKKDQFFPNYFENAIDMTFESIVVKAPEKWHERLSALYSDYMCLPPVEKRRTHGIDAYWAEND